MRAEYALISVSDKSGLEDFASKISQYRTILATEGTARYLEERGIKVRRLSEITGIKESKTLKTLHPNVFRMIESGEIDIVVVNLYTFRENFESIDIGGVTLLRFAAKNCSRVLVVCRPEQYREVISFLERNVLESKEGVNSGSTNNESNSGENLRKKFACEAFKLVARYDEQIARWFCSEVYANPNSTKPE